MSDQREMIFDGLATSGELAGQSCIPVPGFDTVVQHRTYPPGEWRVIWSARHAVGIGQCVYATRAGAREGTRNVARGFQRDGIGYAYAIVSPDGVVVEDGYLDAAGLSTPWMVHVPV